MFVRNAAELYAFDNNQDKLRNALGSCLLYTSRCV